MCGRFGGIDGEDLLGEAGDPQSSALPASLSCCCTSTGLAVDRRDIPAVRNNIFQYCLERAAKIYIVDTPRDVPRMSSSLPSTLMYRCLYTRMNSIILVFNIREPIPYRLFHHSRYAKNRVADADVRRRAARLRQQHGFYLALAQLRKSDETINAL